MLIGHSMGAATALIEAGARNRLGLRGTTSFTATIALSPQGSGSIFPPNAWATVREPVLMITGTRDRELGGAPWTSRTEPFRSMPAGCAWLAVINDATHLQFAGRGGAGRTEALTTAVISSFLGSIRHSACRPPAPIRGLTLETK